MPGHKSVPDTVFLDEQYKRYLCPKCEHLLRDAVQPTCGHWLCQSCADETFEESESGGFEPKCPKADCQEVLESDEGSRYFPDRFVRREIMNLKVCCENKRDGCQWKDSFSHYLDHVQRCEYKMTSCHLCNQPLFVNEVEKHSLVCPKASKKCPLAGLGCPSSKEMGQHELAQHVGGTEEAVLHHLTYLVEVVKGVPYGSPGSLISRGDSQYSSLEESSVEADRPLLSLHFAADVEKDGVPSQKYFAKSQVLSQKEIAKVADKVKEECEASIKTLVGKKNAEIQSLRSQIVQLEKLVTSKNKEVEDRDFRLSLIENTNHDGTVVWKIPQFSQRMADAKNGKYTSIFSLPFHTGRYGYKLCLRLYILGDGIGKGTHMSLFFVVMRGEYDNLLQWPFTHKVTCKLLSQASGRRDVVETFHPDAMSSSFQKPKADMNIASGCPRFISVNDLKNGGYVRDDVIFIKAIVDTSTIKHP